MAITTKLVQIAIHLPYASKPEELLSDLNVHELANLAKISPDIQSDMIKKYATKYALNPEINLSIFSDTEKYSSSNLISSTKLAFEARLLLSRDSDKEYISREFTPTLGNYTYLNESNNLLANPKDTIVSTEGENLSDFEYTTKQLINIIKTLLSFKT